MDGWSGAVAGAGMMCRPEAPIRYSSSAARSCAGEKLFTPRRGGTPSSIDRKNGRRRESGGEGFFSITLAAHLALKTCAWGLVRDSRSAALKFGGHVGRVGPPLCSQDAVEGYQESEEVCVGKGGL